MMGLLEGLSRLYGTVWEARRACYAQGWLRPHRVPGAKVVSVGNLTVGGTGKTTLTLHLARMALAAGRKAAVVCRRYRPGPGGRGDEEMLYRNALGEAATFSGRRKSDLARAAVAAGSDLVLVDDGFSHWALERDLDVVLLDASDLWGGGRLLPGGRLREPRRALARADVVVVTRLPAGQDPSDFYREIRPYAPSARLGASRHVPCGVRGLEGGGEASNRVVLATGTGNPEAAVETAREAGLEVLELRPFADHHAFTRAEADRLQARSRELGARLLLTEKDAVRWPGERSGVAVLEVRWSWVDGGEDVERLVLAPRGEE